MEYTFSYDVNTTNTNVLVAQVSFKEDLTEDQENRLIASFKTGKYYTLDEDDSIRDVYDQVYDTAMQSEEQQPYGDTVGTEVKISNFTYPTEMSNGDLRAEFSANCFRRFLRSDCAVGAAAA